MEIGKKNALDKHTLKRIKKILKDTENRMNGILRATKRKKTVSEKLQRLAEGRAPTGEPRFKVPYECEELEEVATWDGDELTIVIPPGLRWRQVKEKIFIEAMAMQAKADLAITDLQLASLRKKASLDTFLAACKAPEREERSRLENLQLAGIPVPPGLFPDPDPFSYKQAMQLYSKLVRKMSTTKAKLDEEEEKQRDTNHQREQNVAMANPQQIVQFMIRQEVDEYMATKPTAKAKTDPAAPLRVVGVDYTALHTGASASSVVQGAKDTWEKLPPGQIAVPERVRRWSKKELAQRKERGNGQSLGGGRGKGKGKDQAKGKGKNDSNPKGKGKKGKDKGKGKGKGAGQMSEARNTTKGQGRGGGKGGG